MTLHDAKKRLAYSAAGKVPWQTPVTAVIATASWARGRDHAFGGMSSDGNWVCGFTRNSGHATPKDLHECKLAMELMALAALLEVTDASQHVTILASPLAEHWLRRWCDGDPRLPALPNCGHSARGYVPRLTRQQVQFFDKQLVIEPNDDPHDCTDLADDLMQLTCRGVPPWYVADDDSHLTSDMSGLATYCAEALLDLRGPRLTAHSVTRPSQVS